MNKISSDTLKSYDYPAYQRYSEIAGITLFFVYCLLLGISITKQLITVENTGVIVALYAAPVVAYIAADFFSGLVHFLCDNFGTPQTPWFGPGFIRSFREHHDDPKGITKHDFVEVNGSNCMATVPILAVTYHTVPANDSGSLLCLSVFVLFLTLFVFLTNQFHKWAHQDHLPALIKTLQRTGIVLSEKHHAIHHEAPFKKHYCITCGWLNPFLSKIRFFEATEYLLRKLGAT